MTDVDIEAIATYLRKTGAAARSATSVAVDLVRLSFQTCFNFATKDEPTAPAMLACDRRFDDDESAALMTFIRHVRSPRSDVEALAVTKMRRDRLRGAA